MPSGYNALAARPQNRLAYPGGLAKRGASLDTFMPLDYSVLARGQYRQDTPQMREYAANVPIDVLRGRLAATLGLPSDIANTVRSPMPMEMFGQVDYGPQAQVPYGTEQLLKTLPLAPAADNPLGQAANQAGAFVPLTPMEALQAARLARQAALATGRFVAPKAGQLAEQYMVRTGGILPLDVYHGTPHTLPPTPNNPLGEFDASKIGTGEGNQSFGHGIYTAENPNVAKGYAEQLSTAQGPLGDVAKYWRKNGGESAFRSFAKDAGLPPAEIESTANVIRNTGNLYKVDLPDEKIAQMLDWDKPLSQQSENVQQALAQLGYVSDKNKIGQFDDALLAALQGDNTDLPKQPLNLIGEAIYRKLGSPQIASEKLKQLGIPGVQYLDAGSRNAAKGTRNFVVFPGEEKSMTILERNGQPAQMSVADQIDNINEVLKKKRKK